MYFREFTFKILAPNKPRINFEEIFFFFFLESKIEIFLLKYLSVLFFVVNLIKTFISTFTYPFFTSNCVQLFFSKQPINFNSLLFIYLVYLRYIYMISKMFYIFPHDWLLQVLKSRKVFVLNVFSFKSANCIYISNQNCSYQKRLIIKVLLLIFLDGKVIKISYNISVNFNFTLTKFQCTTESSCRITTVMIL